ncbi:unnamed protein product [Nezara viridula]|uniref:Uncharacterized protein n=1 Tax=Nezara viridula TaxID=85310 RepID=A0A9P0HDA5_NEZVI|nr:unnamed protein product [Nezara viridula]
MTKCCSEGGTKTGGSQKEEFSTKAAFAAAFARSQSIHTHPECSFVIGALRHLEDGVSGALPAPLPVRRSFVNTEEE